MNINGNDRSVLNSDANPIGVNTLNVNGNDKIQDVQEVLIHLILMVMTGSGHERLFIL